MRKLTLVALSSALFLTPGLLHAQGMQGLGRAIVEDSADAAAGAAKKNVQGAVDQAAGQAQGQAEGAAAPAMKAKAQAEDVQKNAADTKNSMEGLGNSLKNMGK